ncbi:MAG: assimilatory sulfite reductase (NADPH) hemoprotein subunit [Gammaproteobacteria bacterium]|nr:assimilatory sulfite reductase (NADPH) hemoprotein subunit [Gammaproteobacteria bacterium]
MDIQLNPNEIIKAESNFLRGTLKQSIQDELTGALSAEDAQISKFHGFYEQDDRDSRLLRQSRLLEPDFSFMLRARLPGGVCSARQWLAIDSISKRLGNGSIRLTTRQTFQYHGIIKRHLKPLIQQINQSMIDSIGGCGDVNRNVMCNPNPQQSELHAEVYQWARRISEQLLPQTRAYHEIWLDGEKLEQPEQEELYGSNYLPRKFKTAVAIPPYNDVDIYTNDLGFVAIAEHGKLVGFNVLAGGGMGTTHGDRSTFPRLADELGFIAVENVLKVAEAVVTLQRDEGNRVSRRHARLKYTIERLGAERFKQLLEQRAQLQFKPPHAVTFEHQGDRYGWVQGSDMRWNLTLFIENGRIEDNQNSTLMSGLRAIAGIHQGDFRITPNQNLIIAGIAEEHKPAIQALVAQFGLCDDSISPLRRNSLACVAFPTCPQAMAEAERYFPQLLDQIEQLLAKHQLSQLDPVIRMTGCPNGCARPFVAEIGLVGKGPGRYNLLLGGDGRGQRLNKLYRENLNEAGILTTLDALFTQFAQHALPDERLADFAIRSGLIRAVVNPVVDFHE